MPMKANICVTGVRQTNIPLSCGPNSGDARPQNEVEVQDLGSVNALLPPGGKVRRKNIRFSGTGFFIRTLKIDDASQRWAAWYSDPLILSMLNWRSREWKKIDLMNYIARFDQRSKLLLGIFEKRTGIHVGIIIIHIDPAMEHIDMNLLIGDRKYRNKGVMWDITEPLGYYLFEFLGLKNLKVTVLGHNHSMINYLLKSGWTLERTVKNDLKSSSDNNTMLDRCFFSLSRDAWRAWTKENFASNRRRQLAAIGRMRTQAVSRFAPVKC
jgi:RimJ/RimL family protein N-acetyltransferase